MEWKLNDDRPIWLQLTEQMTRRIITGVYPPGSKLPPVRELAAEAGVNPNTMQRALAQLEQDGLAKADRTAGRLVTQDTAVLDAVRGAEAPSEMLVSTLPSFRIQYMAPTACWTLFQRVSSLEMLMSTVSPTWRERMVS